MSTFTAEAISPSVVLAKWTGLVNGESGLPQTGAWFSDRSVHVSGTFGVGGTVVIEGSNDGVNWQTLRDDNSNLLSFTSADLKTIAPVVERIRPRVTAGDGTTSLNVSIIMVGRR